MIVTTYFANLRKLPESIIPVSICGKAPSWYRGYEYKKLAPKYQFFQEWKQSHDNDYYVKCFDDQVLSKLNVEHVVKELHDMTKSVDIALVCYEKPGDFCHRHLVAEWMSEHGFAVKEYETC